jgi:cytochrome b6-f complex iron-sulfur subunit
LPVAIAIIVILIVAAITIFLTASRIRSTTGSLSRETRQRDQGEEPELSTSTELEATGRARAEETRESLGSGGLVRRRGGAVVEYEPVDEEELGVTRRQFLNRGLLTAVGFGIAGFAPAMLAFLWPTGASGFGGKVKVDKTTDDVNAYIVANRQPYYVPLARTYLVQYPKQDLPAAQKVYKPIVIAGMEKGFVALYQRCVHLGCRVPFCQSSQWFECPCHGSKYNRVGEKKAGPAPRGLDRWPMLFDGNNITIDTSGSPIIGPPIGTNTTGQAPEGPLCV